MRQMDFILILTFTLLISLTTALPVYAQATIEWTQFTSGYAIAVDDFDNNYTVSYEYNPAGDIYLTKMDANGNLVWVRSYNNTDNTKFESSTWVETDNQNNIIVIGDLNSGYSNPVKANSIVMKWSPDGTLLWRVVYEGFFDGSYTTKCLVDNQNNIYVLGTGHGPAGFVTKVKKFAPDGTALWSYFDNVGIGFPINFKWTLDSSIVISCRSLFGSVNGYAKIDRNGNELWSYPGVFSLTVGDAAGDANGNSYLVHTEYVSNGQSQVKKLSPTGTVLWDNVYDYSGFRVDVGSDNNPVVGGFPNQGTGGCAFFKVDGNGTMLWSNPDADGPNALLLHAMMKIDQYDDIYLAAGTLFEMAICKVNSDGSSAWTMLMSGGYARGFAFGLQNSVYVIGGATVKLSQESQGEPPVLVDIKNQSIPLGQKFKAIKVDNLVSDPDTPDPDITWTWSGNSTLQLVWDSVKRGIKVKAPQGWVGSETITFVATDPDGLSDSDEAIFRVTAVAEQGDGASAATMLDNYPNPFNPSTTIRFNLAQAQHVRLTVHNMLGEEVALLLDEWREEGSQSLVFKADGFASGTYFLRFVAGGTVETHKLLLMK